METKLSLSVIKGQLKKVKLPAKDLFGQLKFARIYFQLVNNPTDTALVFKLGDALSERVGELDPAEVSNYLYSKPHIKQTLEEHYLPPAYKVADLVSFVPGTLGHAYYTHMTANNFEPEFYPPVKIVDDVSYLELRGRQTHDIWHVVTGYGVDVVGEVALQAFYMGQGDDSFAMMLVSAGALYSAIHEPKIMGAIALGIGEGYANGKAAKAFYPVKWEEMWHRPLAEIRAEMNVTLPKTGATTLESIRQPELALIS